MILLTQIHEFANSIIREDLLMANKLNREHKSTLFASMFSDKKNALDFTQERASEFIGKLEKEIEQKQLDIDAKERVIESKERVIESKESEIESKEREIERLSRLLEEHGISLQE